jgi:hypothetical protein
MLFSSFKEKRRIKEKFAIYIRKIDNKESRFEFL